MKFQPKNRNIKNTFKYNKGSREGGSLSKSESRDEPQERVMNQQPLKPAKGGKGRNDDLLKRSLKTNQLKAMQATDPAESQDPKYQSGYNHYGGNNEILRELDSGPTQRGYPQYPSSARYQTENKIHYGYDAQYIQSEPIDQGGGYYAPAPTYKNRFKGMDPHAFYAERFQHITPRSGPGLAIPASTRLHLAQTSFGEKRSRSVVLEERSNDGNIALQSSKFKRNKELVSGESGSDWQEPLNSENNQKPLPQFSSSDIYEDPANARQGFFQYNQQKPVQSNLRRFEMHRSGGEKLKDQNESRLT